MSGLTVLAPVRTALSAASILLSVWFMSEAAQAVTLAGSTTGKLDVSLMGAAEYTIPMELPPGTAGVVPSLSLMYSSKGMNGLMGAGWSLAGLSSISRCAANLAQDNLVDPIDYDSNDKFCLDGQKLFAVSGTYGANGTDYRLEIDNLTWIESFGSAGGGPQYFVVKTKSGEIMEYGNTTDSRKTHPSNGAVLMWALNKVSDRLGNYFTISYENNTSTHEFKPLQINYTGHSTSPTHAPYNSVVINYESRSDVHTMYIAGVPMYMPTRISDIEVFAGATRTRHYQFDYEQAAATGTSRLTDMTVCGVGGDCLPPTQFTYADKSTTNFTTQQYTSSVGISGAAMDNYVVAGQGDFDGDGFSDLYLYSTDTNQNADHNASRPDQVWLGKSDGTFDRVTLNPAEGLLAGDDYRVAGQGDFNGDGLLDLYFYESDADGRAENNVADEVWLSEGDGTFNRIVFSASDGISGASMLDYLVAGSGDYNGDGLTDLYLYKADSDNRAVGSGSYPDQVWLSDGDGTFTRITNVGLNALDDYKVVGQGDFNGDGLTDLYFYSSDVDGNANPVANDEVWLSDGDGTFTKVVLGSTSGITTSHDEYRVVGSGDFNGDGLTDLFVYLAQGNSTADGGAADEAWIAKGNGTFARVVQSWASPDDYHLQGTGDFNGDGLTDFYLINVEGPLHSSGSGSEPDLILFSNGDGTFNKVAQSSTTEEEYKVMGQGDFDGDGLSDLYLMRTGDYGRSVGDVNDRQYRAQGPKPDVLVQVEDGFGAILQIEYASLTDPAVYTKGTGASYPQADITVPMQVVSAVNSSNGIGSLNTSTYQYEQARVDLKGRGFLDFGQRTMTDTQTGIQVINDYRQTFPYMGLISHSETRQAGGELLDEADNTYALQGGSTAPVMPYLQQSVAKAYDLNDEALVNTTTTTNTVDSYGNITGVTVVVADVYGTYTKATTNTYTNNATTWILGRLTLASVAHSHSGTYGSSITRKSKFTYNSTNGLLTKEEQQNGAGTTFLTTTYTHDVYGNQKTITVSGLNLSSRLTTLTYDSVGRFPVSTKNALNHIETYEYNNPNGQRTKLTGPNGLVTTWSYDAFGRPTLETRADTTTTTTTYGNCSSGCADARAVFKVSTVTTGAPDAAVYFDELSREIVTEREGFAGTSIYSEVIFDALGRRDKVSRPYYAGATQYYSEYTYDLLGRVIEEESPVTGTTTTAYDGLITTMTNDKGQVTVETQNAMDWTLTVVDADAESVNYDYDATGNLKRVTDPDGNQTVHSYDANGFRTQTVDPDLGTWNYTYDGTGAVKTQQDAKSQTTTYTYDTLGRLSSRSEPSTGNVIWTYDTATNGKGKLKRIDKSWFEREFYYDSLGRVNRIRHFNTSGSYDEYRSYDSASRLDTITYPSGFAIQHTYNAQGYLASIENASTSAVYWTANAEDADGNITQQTYGNGVVENRSFSAATGRLSAIASGSGGSIQDLSYQYDTIGNVTQRQDHNQSLTETFTYDDLNRLTQTSLGGSNTTYTYDALGNVTHKSNVGAYTYAGTKPHAVSSIAGLGSYTYDNNGNLTSGGGRTLTWFSYNLPSQISDGTDTTTFEYDPERQRTHQTISGATSRAIIYIGDLYEKHTTGSLTEHRHYLKGSNGTIAIYSTFSSGSPTIKYLHKDHVGSVDTITNAAGSVLEALSYDPHGQRRNSNWTAGTPSPSQARGYTGHEHLDEVGLVHMNGRIYDPAIGRFLSADPTTQFPKSLQNLNRYSYVLNNPLTYTDPSGFFLSGLFKAILKPFQKAFGDTGVQIIAIAAAVVTYGASSSALAASSGTIFAESATATAIASGFAGGAAGALVSSRGDLQAGLIGGVQGGFTAGIGGGFTPEAIAANGVVGGVASQVQGGDFGSGFLSSAAGAAVGAGAAQYYPGNAYVQYAAAAIGGGTSSAITGGKFVNGAVTAAFSYAASSYAQGDLEPEVSYTLEDLDKAYAQAQRGPIKPFGDITSLGPLGSARGLSGGNVGYSGFGSRGGPPRSPDGAYLPDPAAAGRAHTTLGTRLSKKTGQQYTQGATFDSSGKFRGRTDVTTHGRGDHPNPHFHPATGPASVKSGPHPILNLDDLGR